jgi:predicted dithiol-disulfide oxidoreductase (DUF899 family)
MTTINVENPRVVSQAEWLVARRQLLTREKELTRERDALAAARRTLPWVKVEKEYRFDGPSGEETLADLFDGRRQLVVYHFMFGPGWEEGCPNCSLIADGFDSNTIHLANRDVSLVAISRAPLAEIESFKIQKEDALAFQMGVIVSDRVQWRLSRVVYERGDGERQLLQL